MKKLSEDQLYNLRSAWHCICSGGLCLNSLEEMQDLEKLGLIKLTAAPDEWPEAQYGYLMTDKGEKLMEKQ